MKTLQCARLRLPLLVCMRVRVRVHFRVYMCVRAPGFYFCVCISGYTSAWIEASDHLVLGFCTFATRLPPSFFIPRQSL